MTVGRPVNFGDEETLAPAAPECSLYLSGVERVPLSEVKDDSSRFLHEAEGEKIVITRDGKPAGVLMGFGSEDDWLDYQLENDPRFLSRIERARDSLREGRGVRIEDVK